MLRDRRLARGGALLFCCSPASIFFSSLYTESPFALATFAAFWLLERRRPWAAAAALVVTSGLRANGVLNAGLVLFHALARATHTLAAARSSSTLPAAVPAGTAGTAGIAAASTFDSDASEAEATAANLTGAASATANAAAPIALPRVGMERAAAARRVAGVAGVGAVHVALVLAPYVLWATAAYRRYCLLPAASTSTATFVDSLTAAVASTTLAPVDSAAAAATATAPPEWCHRLLPDLYSHVQSKYWGVGALRYYQWRQLPNFALAAPALCLCASACLAAAAALAPSDAPPEDAPDPSGPGGGGGNQQPKSARRNVLPPVARRRLSVRWAGALLRAVPRLPLPPGAASPAAAAGGGAARAARCAPYLHHKGRASRC